MKRNVLTLKGEIARQTSERAEAAGFPEKQTCDEDNYAKDNERFAKFLHPQQNTGFHMPIYEFFCPNNRRIYSFFARSVSYAGKTPRCPENAKWKLEKLMSSFAITGRAKEKADPPGGEDTMDDPRMEQAMAEMEREFSGMGDTENPDPRMLGRMMRKMADLAGDKAPPAMQEMIARLERGEDPEKLEAEYGDALEGMDEAFGGDDATAEAKAAGATLRRRRKRITRDPTLYEMSEYCE